MPKKWWWKKNQNSIIITISKLPGADSGTQTVNHLDCQGLKQEEICYEKGDVAEASINLNLCAIVNDWGNSCVGCKSWR